MQLFIAFAILALGLAILVANHESGQSFGLSNDDFSRFVVALPILMMLSAGIVFSRQRWAQSLRQLAIWVLIALALIAGYLYRTDAETVSKRILAGLMPGHAVETSQADGTTEIMLYKGISGHFETNIDIGRVSVPVLIDTGASTIALRYEDAVAIGLAPADLSFTNTVLTANGSAAAAPVRIDRLRLGSITRENIQAVVLEAGKLDQSLLGMSFLSTLSGLEMEKDVLRMRD